MKMFRWFSVTVMAVVLLVLPSLLFCEPYQDALIKDVPFIRQKPDFCGEACAAMFLRKLGQAVDQDYVFDQSGLDPLLGRGCYSKELKVALEKIGFELGAIQHKVKVADLKEEMEGLWKAVHADLLKGTPSIVCMRYRDRPVTTEHFRLILGYESATDEVIYHEPAEDKGAYRRMKRSLFMDLWPLKYGTKEWLVIRFRLKPGTLKQATASETFTNADYAQHVMKLKKRVPKGFTTILEPPFIVIGDEAQGTVSSRSGRTVRWSVRMLKKDYFKKDPTDILEIWLFKDKESYRKQTREIFGDSPSTPYGYYSDTHKALIMNIATGGGTLVHEIVHPFMAANFPDCPAWFNEGMGSLYEQCREQGGHIAGLTNWRLAGLQKAIRAGNAPSFKKLTSTSTFEFYNLDKGTNYAQARYLCYYLQQKGLLVKYYHAFVRNCKDDPTGYETLRKVLGEEDLDAFKKKWETYTLKLKFP